MENKEIMMDSELVDYERSVWEKALGAEVEVKPLPDFVTPEVRKNLERNDFKLYYMPRLELGSIDDLITSGTINRYLEKIQPRYPEWKWGDLSTSYWDIVREGKINFPRLPGVWITVRKEIAEHTDPKYIYSNMTYGYMGWLACKRKAQGIAESLAWNKVTRLPSGLQGRLLEPIEWNLLMHRRDFRFKPGRDEDYKEWLNTTINQQDALMVSNYKHNRRFEIGEHEKDTHTSLARLVVVLGAGEDDLSIFRNALA